MSLFGVVRKKMGNVMDAYNPPRPNGDPNSPENADWSPYRPASQTGVSLPPATARAVPEAPDIQTSNSVPQTLPVQPQQPDINRDVYMPQLQNVNQQLTDAYAPHKIGVGHQILGALVGGITHNPQLGGLVTGETQRAQRIQGLTGQEQALGNQINQNRAANTADLGAIKTQADIGELGARTNLYNKQSAQVGEQKPTKGVLLYDKAGNAIGYQDEGGNMMAPDNPALPPDVKSILGSAKTKTPPPSAEQDTQRAVNLRQQQALGKPLTPEDSAWLKGHNAEKTLVPTTNFNLNQPTKNSARSDKSFQYNQSALDKIRTPVDQLAQRFSRLTDTLNQKSPQADALVGPELLTVMAGGQGSGVRLNEAEISRIVGGRSSWQNLQAAIQHWSTNPADARSITPEQDKQIRDLIAAVGTKMTAKQKAIDDAQDSLLNTDDPAEHRRIVAGAKKSLDTIDSGGGGGPASTGETNQSPPRPPRPGFKWQQNTRTKEYREVPVK